MAASGQRLIPLDGMQLDVAPQYLKATQARFIKNLYYQLSDLGEAGTEQGANTGVLKPLPSNEIYCPVDLPVGDNHVIGTLPCRETNELYVLVYNSLNNHSIFVVNGIEATADIIKVDPCFDFKLEPQYFCGEGQIYLEVIYLIDPTTDLPIVKKDLYWTLGINYQGYLRVGDSIATNGFDATLFPYFQGNYDKCSLVRMGLPTPDDCIEIKDVPFNPLTDTGKNNNIKNATWQFRILDVDVFGRPSEHGMISDTYYVTGNDCLGASDMLSRCVNLTFPAGNPFIDKKQIEYRNCNDEQWKLDTVLELYQGSNLGEWWTRSRNPDINYDFVTNKITYTFCKDKLCDPIDKTETNRTEPALPRTSQALTKIGRDIALANNKDRFTPLSQELLNQIEVEVIKPNPSNVGETVNITVWIRIFNPTTGRYQKVWYKDNSFAFGGIAYTSNGDRGIDNIKTAYQQYFALPDQRGYIGYLAGTNNYAVGVQYYLDSNNNFVKDADFNEDISSRQYFLKFEYNSVQKNNYIFRLAGHLADTNSGVDIRTTSTYVGGVYNFSNLVVGTQKTYFKELIINACDADYDTLTSGEMLIAFDMTRPVYESPLPALNKRLFSNTTVFAGQIYSGVNTITNANENPVPLLQVQVTSPGHSNINSIITDHNGFYFSNSISNRMQISFYGYCSCVKRELVRRESGNNNESRLYTTNMIIGLPNLDDYITSCPDFDIVPCSKVLIKGKVQLCNGGTPVPNINVVLSRGGIGTTDSNGEFTIIAFDDAINGVRNDKLYVMGGGCAFTDCNGNCIEVKDVSFAACVSCTDRELIISTYEVLFISSRGLLSNGRYGIALTPYDWLGRHWFSQTQDRLYFDIPSINETQTFAPSTVNVIVPPSVTFPKEVDYFTIGITAELNYGGNLIEWIADKVEFVDNSGTVNNTAPTQIKIYYNSLNEFNSQNNFNTTTGWQIIPTSETEPRTADIVQFIRNGDGIFFPNPITALVKYNKEGQYFLINYVDALKDLKENALIRLANPQDCANKDIFFELCGKYKVVNGKSQQNKITLNAYDTYYQYRQIPIPVTTGTGDTATTVIELRQFGFPFEHSSVTDFWGYRCWNVGRINAKNPYEAELIHLDQVALSGALSVNAQLNYLNYFDDANKYDIRINNSGGILYVRVKTGVVLVICQYVHFLIGFNDNIARVNAQGDIIVPSAEGKFGQPFRDSIAAYGCQNFDKNTIREKEGLVQWLDVSRVAILQHDYSKCTDVSRYNKSDSTIVSWLTKKIKYVQDYNKTHANKIYFHSVINPTNFEWLLTNFTIGSDNYVNEERDKDVTKHETISLDIINQVWKNFISPTPEYFSYLENSGSGQILFAFKKGIPYSHNGSTYNEFFGIKCESIYRYIFNTDGFKKKKFQSLWVYCVQQLFWSDLILTETQQSRLLKNQFKKHDYFWSAPFLCDINTPTDTNTPQVNVNKLTDGNNLFGGYLDTRLVNDSNEYFELYGVIVFAAADEQSGA